MRLFIAVDLPADLRRLLADLSGRLRPSLPGARWVRPEGIHLTLRFLGETAEERLAGLQGALRSAVAGAMLPFEVKPGGAGVFPVRGKPRVLWLGLKGDSSLERLHNVVEDAVLGAGFPPEDRPFRPHLTLARFPGRVGAEQLEAALASIAEIDPPPVVVSKVALFESVLGPGGASYRIVEDFEL